MKTYAANLDAAAIEARTLDFDPKTLTRLTTILTTSKGFTEEALQKGTVTREDFPQCAERDSWGAPAWP